MTASSLSLVWVKVNNWVMETECRTYQCRKFVPGDVLAEPGDIQYQVRRRGIVLGVPQDSFAEARRIVEADIRASSSSTSSAASSAHGTATREASQGRSSSSRSKAVTAEVHGASIGPDAAGVQ